MSEEKLPDFCLNYVEELASLKSRVTILESAFPDGAANHRRAHEDMIAAALADRTFVRELKLDAAKKGLWVMLLVIVGIFLIGLEAKVRAWLGIGH